MSLVTGIDYLQFYVGNSFQSSDWFCSKFGFIPFAYEGFQTGNRNQCTHVVKQKDITFCFTSALTPSNVSFYDVYQQHGDNHIHDVALSVTDVNQVFNQAVAAGAIAVQEPKRFYFTGESSEQSDEYYIETAVIKPPFAKWVHTLVNRNHAGTHFLPRFQHLNNTTITPDIEEQQLYQNIDHLAYAIEKDSLKQVVQWYSKALGFTRFLSNDDDSTESGISVQSDVSDAVGLRTMVMTPDSTSNSFKFVFVEPVNTNTTKSQIQEFLDYHGGPGVAHAALYTEDIISCVSRSRSVQIPFISAPYTYYNLWKNSKIEMYDQVREDWEQLQKQSILVDGKMDDGRFDYLLQTFTEPLQDRPTFYLEVITRRGANGFGKGNIKSLFDAIEALQKERGNFEVTTNTSDEKVDD
jgi:4-hydroxyphenylpyruvate dioxygenase